MAFESFVYEEKEEFKALEVGDYRIKIVEAEKMKSNSGKDMLKLVFAVSGSKTKIYHYIVDGQYFNQQISRFFDAFPQIEKGNFNVATWIGKMGACHTKQEEYNGNINAKVHYFIHAGKQGNLPVWVDADDTLNGKAVAGFIKIVDGDEELPF